MATPLVGIIMGSANDAEVMNAARETLNEFGISCEFRALSAHRTPDEVAKWAQGAEERGLKVIIAGAGMAAHLAGAVAAHSALPVIGVPLPGDALSGLDSLLSTVQMPKGTPVATMAIGKAGAANAGLFAARILALSDKGLRAKITEQKKKLADAVRKADEKLG